MSIIGLLILIADIYAIFKIFESKGPVPTKAVWAIVILLLPVIGLLLWWFVGPGKKK